MAAFFEEILNLMQRGRGIHNSHLILSEDNAAEGLVPKTRPQVDGGGAVHHLVRLDVLEPHLRQGERHQLRES